MKPYGKVYGITPLDTSGGMWESDYKADIAKIHFDFSLQQPLICERISVHNEAVKFANDNSPFSVIYVDGAHDFSTALFDMETYSKFVGERGYLVVDDCNGDMHMPWGFFQGIDTVTAAKQEWLKTQTDFEFVCSVVHISVWRKVK